ncbi:ATP-dependent DNA helicase [Kangiella sp. TOML190]|uniref:ATP-dependent DNA helicase n=1 Tax=Kangiella sp. TOML190 TaxID=2931351 RepID=UPI00203FD8BE|nr:ATP-dependent DNA helicase [Kangiella sp. TOML190]
MSDYSIANLFSSEGLLAQAFEGFIERQAQVDMAQAIAEAIESETSICIEAGTGTGKTFAYLVPALLAANDHDKKVIISTGTKNLQDQLYFRDLPSICDALSLHKERALLKGRNNYLCIYRLNQNLDSGRFQSRSMADTLVKVNQWSNKTVSGDLTQCPDLKDNDPLWGYVTSSNENCLGADCPDYADCYLVKARQKAIEADLVVVNHHLLLADMVLKEDGFGELLPEADMVIADEAHQVAAIAHGFYGHRLTSRQVSELCRDSEIEAMTTAKDDRQLSVAVRRVEGALNEIRLKLGDSGKKINWLQLNVKVRDSLFSELLREMKTLSKRLDLNATRSKGLDSCHRRSVEILQSLVLFEDKELNTESVRWLETYRTGFAVVETPLDVSQAFEQSRLEHGAQTWVFTSATLSQARKFDHFKSQLGLHQAQELMLDSPFDYQQQSLLYVPRGLPDPRNPKYIESWFEAVWPLIEANAGGTFLLFTSYYALNKVRDLIEDKIEKSQLLVQGERPKNELIEAFREQGNAVLLATSSFWEGVDVKGMALSLVVIDKLPFAAPDEPLIEAKVQSMRKKGKNPFYDLQIPEAITALKQGAGRLIRDQEDRGVLVLCDPRLVANHYGKAFLTSLPDLPRTRDQKTVVKFLQNLEP